VTTTGHAGVLEAAWTAPTTNADGNPLTNLAYYRVYYATSAVPCPGPTFFMVASDTQAPPPNTQVTFSLTGLATEPLLRCRDSREYERQ